MSRTRMALVALLVAMGALVAWNARDEDLSPEARALFERPAREFSRESGWALLAGFDAPPGQDPRAYAKAPRPAGATRPKAAPRPYDELVVRAPAELLCLPEKVDCVRAYAARPHFIDDLATDNGILLGRYDELLRASGLSDVVHGADAFDAFFPANLVMGAQRIRLSQVGAAVARGHVDPAIAWLEADVDFSRRWLEQADTLLSKMLALRAYSRPVIMAGQVARSAPQLTPGQVDRLARIAAPLTVAQRGLAAPMRSEAALFAQTLDETIAMPVQTAGALERPAFMSQVLSHTVRRNATLNFAAPLFATWTRLDAVDSAELEAALEALRETERRHLSTDLRWAYNYPGRAYVREGHYDPSQYVMRLRDGDALAALVRCTVTLRARGTPRESAGTAVAAEPSCRDPYSRQPFAWDAQAGELWFRARSSGTAERFGGRGDRVAFAPFAS